MIAGRAQTIYDTNHLLGAFGQVRPDPDDPKEFRVADRERPLLYRTRTRRFAKLLGR